MLSAAYALLLVLSPQLAFEAQDCLLAQKPLGRLPETVATHASGTSLYVNTRVGNTNHFSWRVLPSQQRIMVIEGFGPVAELSDCLERAPALEELSLICITLSDSEALAISRLPQLVRLDLRGCVVSDAQLELLCSIATLQEVDLRGAVVSQSSQQELCSRFPHLLIRASCDSQ